MSERSNLWDDPGFVILAVVLFPFFLPFMPVCYVMNKLSAWDNIGWSVVWKWHKGPWRARYEAGRQKA